MTTIKPSRGSPLPTLTFLSLTLLSLKLILAHLFTFEPHLRAQCIPGSKSPPNIPYTTAPAVDAQLCFMVAFFHSALDHPLASDFLTYFIGTSSISIVFPLIEGARSGQTESPSIWRSVLAYPEAWLGLSQVASLGVTMCLYGLVFVLSSPSTTTPVPRGYPETDDGAKEVEKEGRRRSEDESSLSLAYPSQTDIESAVVATFLGVALPSWALFAYRNPSITVLWQAFPLYVYIARVGYRRVREAASKRSPGVSPSSSPSSPAPHLEDDAAIRLVLYSSFILSAYFHVNFVLYNGFKSDVVDLLSFMFSALPSHTSLQPTDALSINVLIFLIWDFVFSFVSAFLALGFEAYNDGRRLLQSKATIVGYVLGCILVGPGATLAICVLRREERLRERAASSR